MVMSELSIHELETQQGELLPEREALGGYFVNLGIFAQINQVAVAHQALTALSYNSANNYAAIVWG